MLIVYDAVCRHKSMTLAAKDVGLTQPAVSRYMRELKEITGEELLFRNDAGYQLTEAGERFWRIAVDVLNGCEFFTRNQSGTFDPKTDSHVFRFGFSLLNTVYFTEHIALNALEKYPNIDIHMGRHASDIGIEKLKKREIDAFMGYQFDMSDELICHEKIKTVDFCVMCSSHSPLSSKRSISAKDFVSTPHLKVDTGPLPTAFDVVLKHNNLMQDRILQLPDLASVILVLKRSDHIFFMLRDHAKVLCAQDPSLIMLETKGFEIPSMDLMLYWNKSNENYAPHQWLRSFVRESL